MRWVVHRSGLPGHRAPAPVCFARTKTPGWYLRIVLLGCGLRDGEQDLAVNRCAGGRLRMPGFPGVTWVSFELPIAVRALFTRVCNSLWL